MDIQAVVFDIGGVLVDWNPRHLYRRLISDAEKIEYFLSNICSYEWNAQQDAGRSFKEGVAVLQKQHPQYTDLIEAFDTRWHEMLGEANYETIDILKQLSENGFPVYALTNWSKEKFPIARQRYDFFNLFKEILVSGEVGMKKPDSEFYNFFLNKFQLQPDRTIFIDDLKANVDAANQVGMIGIQFKHAAQLKQELKNFGIKLV